MLNIVVVVVWRKPENPEKNTQLGQDQLKLSPHTIMVDRRCRIAILTTNFFT